jgi:Fe-S-cluster containining protein
MEQIVYGIKDKMDCFDQICTAWIGEYLQRGGTVYCGKGCGGCCSLVVNCTLPEALHVAAALNIQQIKRLSEKIQKIQLLAVDASNLKDWLLSYRQNSDGCPFLEKRDICGIYNIRPFSCRSLISTMKPDWCVTDFSSFSMEEKRNFIDLLDQSAVAFPTHYAATPQEIGEELEKVCLKQMETAYGFSISGSLPWLVWLELEYSLSAILLKGEEYLKEYLNSRNLLNQYLILIG